MREKLTTSCPEVWQLEAYLTDQLSSQLEKKYILMHVDTCRKCSILNSELDKYYKIFVKEIKKSASNSVFKLIKHINSEELQVAGILLKLEDQVRNKNLIKYKSRLISSSDSLVMNLNDLENVPLDKHDILVRAIQSTKRENSTTLYLYSLTESLCKNVGFQILPDEKIYKCDEFGQVNLDDYIISQLENKEINIIFE